MKTRKVTVIVGILVSLLMVSYAMAHGVNSGMGMQGQGTSHMAKMGMLGSQGMGMGMKNGRGMVGMGWVSNLNLSQEQKTKLAKLRQKFMMDTLETRSKLAAKRVELRTLFTQSGINSAKLKTTYKELLTLQMQMMERRFDFRLAMRGVLTPDQLSRISFGHSKGMGMMGRRGGMCQCGRMRMQ
jgi:Spy/CpxP family protein refolding chaperone